MILKKLTEIQSSSHPDYNTIYNKDIAEKYFRAAEAKSFVRKHYSQN